MEQQAIPKAVELVSDDSDIEEIPAPPKPKIEVIDLSDSDMEINADFDDDLTGLVDLSPPPVLKEVKKEKFFPNNDLEMDCFGKPSEALQENGTFPEKVKQNVRNNTISSYRTFMDMWMASYSTANNSIQIKCGKDFRQTFRDIESEQLLQRYNEFNTYFCKVSKSEFKVRDLKCPAQKPPSGWKSAKKCLTFFLNEFKQHFKLRRRLVSSEFFLVMHLAFPHLNPLEVEKFPNTIKSELDLWEERSKETLDGEELKDELYTIGLVRENVNKYCILADIVEVNENRLYAICRSNDLIMIYRTFKGLWSIRLRFELQAHLTIGTKVHELRLTLARQPGKQYPLEDMTADVKDKWRVDKGTKSKKQRMKIRKKRKLILSAKQIPEPVKKMPVPRRISPEPIRRRTPEPERRRTPERRRKSPEPRKRTPSPRGIYQRGRLIGRVSRESGRRISPVRLLKRPLPSLLDMDLDPRRRSPVHSRRESSSNLRRTPPGPSITEPDPGPPLMIVDTMIDEQGRKILFMSEKLQTPGNHITVITTGLEDYVAALDMVSMATNRSQLKVVELFKHETTEAIIQKISERMGCELVVQTEKDVTPTETICKSWCYLKNSLVVATMGVGRGPTESVSRAYALASMLAAFCHLLIIPYEMVRIVQNLGVNYIDSIIFSCRKRFVQFSLLSENQQFSHLALCGWPEGVDAETLQQWTWFIHQMREQGSAYWKGNNVVFLPTELPLRATPIFYFTFEALESVQTADWEEMKPSEMDRTVAHEMKVIETMPDSRFGVFDFEKGVIGEKYEASQNEPEDGQLPVAKLCGAGDLETFNWFGMRDVVRHAHIDKQFTEEKDYRPLVQLIARMWNRQLVYRHSVTTEVNDMRGRRHHNISVSFYGIPYLFLGATTRHVNPRICLRRAFKSLLAQLIVLRILPMELFYLRENFGGQWDCCILYGVRFRFAALENMISKPIFSQMYEQSIANLRPFQFLYSYTKTFVLRMQAEGRAYWLKNSIIMLPLSLQIPEEPRFLTMYFTFQTNGIDEVKWQEMHGTDTSIDVFDDSELAEEVCAEVPQWEFCSTWKNITNAYLVFKNNRTDFPLSDVLSKEYVLQSEKEYMELLETINPGRMEMIITLIRSFVYSLKTGIIVQYQQDGGIWYCRVYVEGVMKALANKIFYHKKKAKAYHGAILQLYCFFMKYMVAIPKLEEFVIEDTERLQYVASFTSDLNQTLIMGVLNSANTGTEIESALNKVLETNTIAWLTNRLPLTPAMYEKKKKEKRFEIIPCTKMSMDQMAKFQMRHNDQGINLAKVVIEDESGKILAKNAQLDDLRSNLKLSGFVERMAPLAPKFKEVQLDSREQERQKLLRELEIEKEKLAHLQKLQESVINHPPALNTDFGMPIPVPLPVRHNWPSEAIPVPLPVPLPDKWSTSQEHGVHQSWPVAISPDLQIPVPIPMPVRIPPVEHHEPTHIFIPRPISPHVRRLASPRRDRDRGRRDERRSPSTIDKRRQDYVHLHTGNRLNSEDFYPRRSEMSSRHGRYEQDSEQRRRERSPRRMRNTERRLRSRSRSSSRIRSRRRSRSRSRNRIPNRIFKLSRR